MLTAILNNGERICLGDGWEKDKLLSIRDKEYFTCPQCKGKVILKLGEKRIFHFSHLKDSKCEFEHAGESEYHLNGKMQLYQWLKEQNLSPVLEYYDSEIRQRADVMFCIGNKRYAIEFQCSNINEKVLKERTAGYCSKGYQPIWILGANQLLRNSYYKTSLSDFHYLFLQKTTSNHWVIPFYCSINKKFILHRSIQPISIRNVISDQLVISLDKMKIAHLIEPPNGVDIKPKLWINELNRWKNKTIRLPGAYQNPFLITLYQNNLNLLLLPPFLGLPVKYSPSIMTPPVIWQTYLFLDVFFKKKIGSTFRFHDVYIAFMKRSLQKQIQTRQLPLIEEGNATLAIHQYLLLLVNLKILQRQDENIFIVNQPMITPRSVCEQKRMEEDFYNKYRNMIFK